MKMDIRIKCNENKSFKYSAVFLNDSDFTFPALVFELTLDTARCKCKTCYLSKTHWNRTHFDYESNRILIIDFGLL